MVQMLNVHREFFSRIYEVLIGGCSDGLAAKYLSLPFPNPYLMPGSDDPTKFKEGVNFASAQSGILDSTFLWEVIFIRFSVSS